MNLINISDHPLTGLKRKVEIDYFTHRTSGPNSNVMCTVHHYKNVSGAYGDLISTEAVHDFQRQLTADNSRQVDPTDGMVCLDDGTGVFKRVDTQAVVASPIGQYDFFTTLVESGNTNIPAILTGTVQSEDAIFHSFD